MRVGMGYDVHRLVEDRDLIIGGVKIPYEKGLLGHSDADPKYKGISSIELLKRVGNLLDENGFVVENIDATIIAQKPKMRPHIEQMEANIAAALCIEQDRINVKATTEEGLGFTGSGEGISSQAICMLQKLTNMESTSVMPPCGGSGCAGCGGCQKR